VELKHETSGDDPAAVKTAREQLEQDVRMKLRLIFSSAKKQSRDIETRCGVNATQFWVLTELKRRPGMRVSDLARLICIHNSTASNLLDRLEERGLLRRERKDEDQRVVRLYLTPAGANVIATLPQPARSVVPDALGDVPLGTLETLNQSLGELIAHLKIADTSAILTPLSDI
jgi:MarR family transcriptional regulator, organic hydroperoxide resistance regulator